MCEQLLLLPVLLAVTFKCQDSYSPIRKDQSSHVEKSQHTDFNFSHNCPEPLCLCQCLSLQSTSQHTQRIVRQHYQYILATRNQARKHAQHHDRHKFTRARKYWDWELCHLPSAENKTKHLNPCPHIYLPRFNGNRLWRWMWVLKCWIYIFFSRGQCSFFFLHCLSSFLTVVPTCLWSGSELLAATSIILPWNISKLTFLYSLYTGRAGLLSHQLLCALNRWNTGVFYTTDGQFTAEQGKETK